MQIFSAVGRLTRNPELKFTQNQKAVATFTLAVDRGFGEETDFFNCQAWGKTAENVSKYLTKGSQCQVIGEVHIDKYLKEGRNQYYTKINVNKVKFLDKLEVKQSMEMYTEELPADDIPF